MRQNVRPVRLAACKNDVADRTKQARPNRVPEDEHEHRGDRALFFCGPARRRLLRRFPRTDLHA